ncbi:MAG: hypothetical protein JEZ07_00605 [Phycisphaerae bacterium]|nr:hypothetical protein [Phycisphaerae bacterium]
MVKRCTLYDGLVIEPAGMGAYGALKDFHYRNGRPGFVDKVFAIYSERKTLVYKLGGKREVVGVIVYSMPVINCRLRNVATDNRYCGSDRSAGLKLLNSEMRCISRVIIAPQYRGMSLGSWLVKETLDMAGTKYVEALAVMGRINPFFEKAGMIRYDGGVSAEHEKLLATFDEMEIKDRDLISGKKLMEAIDGLGESEKELVCYRIKRFMSKYVNKRQDSFVDKCEFVVEQMGSVPVYFIKKKRVRE